MLEGLTRFGIPIREVHEHHGHPSQPRHGKRFYQDRLVDLRLEKEVILMIRDLRSKGYSLRRIARMLNVMAVPTKWRGKAWHPEMVRRILGARDDTDN